MKRYTLILLIIVAFLTVLNSEEVLINNNSNSINLISSDNNTTILELNIGSFYKSPIQIDGQEYFQIQIANEAETYQKGAPELPTLTRSIIIDKSAKPELRIIDSEYSEFKIPVIPSKGVITRDIDPDTIPYEFGDVYNVNAFYPAQATTLNSPYIMRNYRGVAVTFNPFQYNPQTGVLRVYSRLKVEVTNSSKSGENILTNPAKNVSSFQFLYENHFLNYETNRYTPLDEFGSILVIAPQNYISTMQIYANWKIQKGIPTQIVDVATIGNNATSIKNYIQNYYNTHPDLAFVQIAGDAAQVATLSSGGGGADPMYALVAGNDSYPDIFIGRFSAETTSQLLTQVERTLNYERDLNSSATYLTKATGIASNEGGGGQGDNGESDIQHMNIIRTNLLNYNYTQVDQFYAPSATAAAVANALNEGRGHVNYVGHGSNTTWSTTGFSNNHINNLTNVGKLPFIVSVACVNGNFVNLTCFAEAWMRATYNDEPTGAMAIYASTINQSWSPPMRGQDEINQLLTGEVLSTIGGLYYSGSCDMMDAYGTDGINMYKTWHIFGDASLQVRTDVPQPMLINHSGLLPAGSSTYSVSTGVADALVAITYNNQLLGSSYANSSGNVTLNLTNIPTTPTDLTLTVTAFNKVTVVEPVSMSASDGPYLTLSDFTFNDANNNGLLEYGETGSLNLVIENIGTAASSSGNITFSESDPYLNLTSTSASVSAISAGGTQTINNVINFIIANDIPNNHTMNLSYVISAGGEEYTGNITLTGKSYEMEIYEITIDDSVLGNGNNVIDAGESFSIVVMFENTGDASSPSASASIDPANYISYGNTTSTIPALSAGATSQIVFVASASNSIPAGEEVTFTVNASYPTGDLEFSQGFLAALLQIGEGIITDAHLPMEPYYGYTYSQSIYTASELNLGVSQINKIAYHYNGNSTWTDNIVVYMGNTTKTSFSSTSDWIALSNISQVYAGSFTAPATAGWVEIVLDTPFTYDGTSNLVIGFDENTQGYHSYGDEFYCYSSGSNRSIYYYSDTTNPNPASPPSGTVSGYNPNIRIFASGYSADPGIAINTNNINFGSVLLTSPVFQILTITNSGGENLTGLIRINNNFSIQEMDGYRSKQEILERLETRNTRMNINFSISPLQSHSYIISHSTNNLGEFSGSIAITSNDPVNQNIEIPLWLEVVNPPSISLNIQNIEMSMQPGLTATHDLSIINTGDLDLTCSLNLQITEAREVTEIFTANFDDHDLSDWSIDYLYSADHTWHIADSYGVSSSSLDGSSFLFIDSDAASYNDINDIIETPAFNVSAYEEITIEFDHYFRKWSEEIIDVDFWTGSEWINIGSWQGESVGSWTSPSHFIYTLTNEGYSDVKLRFHYYNAHWEYYWAIDNLVVSGLGTPAPQWVTLPSEFTSLTVTPDTSQDITLNFSSVDFVAGQYTASLNIQSNSALNNSLSIPITLTISELENEPDWQPVIYPNNSATIYAEVTHLSDEIADDDIISAWVGDECRGLGQIVIVNRSQAFTTIVVQSNGTTENVYFKLYDRSADIVIEESNSTPVSSGQVVGSAQEPFPINIGVIELIAPNNLNIEITNSIANINWNAVPNADYYKVFYSSDFTNWLDLGDVNGTTYQHTQPRAQAHFYKIKAMKN